MFRVLRFSAQATLAQVTQALRRAPARRLALVFPPGARPTLADEARLATLAEHCARIAKDVTIVGGDELLRASAVAAGLRAARTLEDWRAVLAAAVPEWGRAFGPKPRGQGGPLLALVPPPAADPAATVEWGDDDEFAVDPPEYVREILALHGRESDARGPTDARPSRSYPAYRARASALALDQDDEEAMRLRSERDEELLTAAIRRTSGLDAAIPSARWHPTPLPPLAGEAAEREGGPGVY